MAKEFVPLERHIEQIPAFCKTLTVGFCVSRLYMPPGIVCSEENKTLEIFSPDKCL